MQITSISRFTFVFLVICLSTMVTNAAGKSSSNAELTASGSSHLLFPGPDQMAKLFSTLGE